MMSPGFHPRAYMRTCRPLPATTPSPVGTLFDSDLHVCATKTSRFHHLRAFMYALYALRPHRPVPCSSPANRLPGGTNRLPPPATEQAGELADARQLQCDAQQTRGQ
jgi:hypothetical protein